MGRMIRKQLYIEPSQEILLKEKARDLGLSEGELVREALSRYLSSLIPQRKQTLSVWDEERAFIRQLRAEGQVEGKRTWRREDAYDVNRAESRSPRRPSAGSNRSGEQES